MKLSTISIEKRTKLNNIYISKKFYDPDIDNYFHILIATNDKRKLNEIAEYEGDFDWRILENSLI